MTGVEQQGRLSAHSPPHILHGLSLRVRCGHGLRSHPTHSDITLYSCLYTFPCPVPAFLRFASVRLVPSWMAVAGTDFAATQPSSHAFSLWSCVLPSTTLEIDHVSTRTSTIKTRNHTRNHTPTLITHHQKHNMQKHIPPPGSTYPRGIEIGRFRVWLKVGIDGRRHGMQFIPHTPPSQRRTKTRRTYL